MDTNASPLGVRELDLADWRERVARLYLSDVDLAAFRAGRDELFRSHPQSPLPVSERAGFGGLRYFPFNADAVVDCELGASGSSSIEIDAGGQDGTVRYRSLGVAVTPYGPLTLWWLEAYGGGLFLPFRDGTCGHETYGGGRYLTDTIKGTHGRGVVVVSGNRVRLDFNYAYNPSCAFSVEWPARWRRARTGSLSRSGPARWRTSLWLDDSK